MEALPNHVPDRPVSPDERAAVEAARQVLALPPGGLLMLCGLLAGELAKAKQEAEPELVTREELQRRCGFLAARAVPAGLPGKLLCRWCGTMKAGFNPLRQHYERIHADDVKAMPAAAFGDSFGPVSRKARPAAEAFKEANSGRFQKGHNRSGPTPGPVAKNVPAAGGEPAAGHGEGA